MMMRRLVIIAFLAVFSSISRAEAVDAFHGVLPVTDNHMKKSLNGKWLLKVIDGVSDDMSIPEADATFRTIPVPGCWEAYGFCKPSYDSARPLTGYYHTSFSVPDEWRGRSDMFRQFVRTTSVRVGRKPTMAEQLKQKGRLPQPYLVPLDNKQVKAYVKNDSIAGGRQVSFTLTPDTANVFHAELGIAYLLDTKIDRFQWIGQGPFPSYPGRYRANRYGFWAMRPSDLYFEGNRMGVDALYCSDAHGDGLLLVGDSLSLSFEQTDRGVVLTVNADVAGQGPKFARTHFPSAATDSIGVSASFRIYHIKADQAAQVLYQFFALPDDVPTPFRPFKTQYDTYLMRYDEIN